MPISFDDLRSRDNDTIDRDYLNRRWRLIAENIRLNADSIAGIQSASDNLIGLGLARINEILGPTINKISAAADIGFLTETSQTLIQMVADERVDLEVDDNAQVEIFSPTPFLVICDNADYDNWAIVRLLDWNKTTRALSVRPIIINGSGYGSNWSIAVTAGILPAMESALAQAQAVLASVQSNAATVASDKLTVAADKATTVTAKNTAVSASNSAASSAGLAATSASNAQSSANAAASSAQSAADIAAQLQTAADEGPVQSVNGKIGVVNLTASDLNTYTTTQIDNKIAVIDSGTF